MQLDVLDKLEEKIEASLGTIRSLRKEKNRNAGQSGITEEEKSLLQAKLRDMLTWLDELEDLTRSEALKNE